MKQTAKIATLAIALCAGIGGSAFANGTYRAEPERAPVIPEAAPAPKPYTPPPAPVVKSTSEIGPYVSGSVGVGIPGNSNLKTGYVLNGALGYNFDPMRAEVAVGYQTHDLKHFDDDISYLSVMANGYYDFEAMSGVKPYLMAGAGVASIDRSWASDNNTSFAWQLGAGVGVQIADRTTLDLGYRYFRPDNGNTDFQGHNIMAGIRYQF
jgi:opacity protein-like surface antigen